MMEDFLKRNTGNQSRADPGENLKIIFEMQGTFCQGLASIILAKNE